MDERVKMIKDFCEDRIYITDLSIEVKDLLVSYGFIKNDGKFTKMGTIYKNAVTTNPDLR
ncbi:hypothetical protein M3589_23535 [Heyndrickxia oleronia]|uniref:hypothetical protein n=1 Tax=Heyndrickxia oleronia TaxID=38875 RepID=UPI00203C7B24|nr:hypothetical protein [Heyndrickxia oleronia]MCM3240635.1 hypothetical protein [Heyndrickxia oleronia]